VSRQQRYRVIQWATGMIGTRAMRAVIDHPDLELVGLWVRSPDLAGRDAGELAGTAANGIKATNSVDEIVALEADCVLYMRKGTDYDEVARLLASGKNVVTTTGEFHHAAWMPADDRRKIEQACEQGRTSIYDTGSSPGFSTEILPTALLSLSRRLDRLTIDEYADVSSRNSPDMLFNVMGFNRASLDFDQNRVTHLKDHFATSLAQLAETHGIAIEDWEGFGEYAPATRTFAIAAGTVEAGHTAAQRITIQGVRGGKPVLRMRLNWYLSREIDAPGWDLGETGWRVQVEGDTPLDVRITFPVAPEHFAAMSPGLTAHLPVNAIAFVCAAAPGICTTAGLGQIVARL
jgi:hypothetical protein